MKTTSIDIINRATSSIDFRKLVSIFNFDLDRANIAIYSVIHRNKPTIRSCNRSVVIVTQGQEVQKTIRTLSGIVVKSSFENSIFFTAEGIVDQKSLIKSIFDNLPNYFSSLSEQEEQDE